MSQRCFEGQHFTLSLALGIPGLLAFVIAPPAVMFITLFRYKGEKLYQYKTKVKLLFLYHSYNDQYFFWEAAKMLFILSLVCVRVFGTLLEEVERLALFLIILTSFTLTVV